MTKKGTTMNKQSKAIDLAVWVGALAGALAVAHFALRPLFAWCEL
ncbi:MAG: hypothetical protein ACPGVG_13070 [Mycobacterium sp.]